MEGTEDLLISFERFLARQCKEESTIRMYIAEVRKFLGWVRRSGRTLPEIRMDDLLSFRGDLEKAGVRSATINKSLSVVSTFFKWAHAQGHASGNPAEHVRIIDTQKAAPPRWLSAEEEEKLLKIAAMEQNPFKRARNLALLHTMLYAGLRVEEVSDLRLESLRENELLVFHGEEPARAVPLSPESSAQLREWVRLRGEAGKTEYVRSPYLFITERMGAMQPRAVQFVVEGYSEKLGFPVLCQHLRHTYCRRLAEQDMPIERIQRLAGQKSPTTTRRYFQGLDHFS
nr:tyrosine-type recombinase/integrase [Cohnella zeiphila]